MIVYYAMTKFHLLFCLTHNLLKGKKDDTVLILYSNLSDVEQYRKKILEKKYFSKVYILNEIEMRNGWKGATGPDDIESLNYNIECIIHAMENWLPFNLSETNEIYLTNDHWSLGIYCICKKIPYYFYEDGVGMLSKPDYSYELVYKLNKTHAYLSKYIEAFSKNENVIAKYADLTNQSDGFDDPKAIHYSVTDNLGKLSPKNQCEILDIFGMEQIHIESDHLAALFTEHFVNMKRLTILQQYELYAILIDYFVKGFNLVVKPHPNDVHVNYLDIFPEAKMIDRGFPSELLPYCVDKKIIYGVAACSTAVLGLKKYFNDVIRFDINIEKKYCKFHRYFALFHILKSIRISHCDICGIEQDIFHNFNKIFNVTTDSSTGYKIVIIDEVEDCCSLHDIDLSLYDYAIFLSPFDNYSGYETLIDTQTKDNFVFLEIEKIKFTNTYLLNDDSEYILIYTANFESKQELEGFHIMNKLEHTGAQININIISNNDKVKIKFLEAYLDSANKKIKYYMEREKELLKLINDDTN